MYVYMCSMPFTSIASLVGLRLAKSVPLTTVNGSSRSNYFSNFLHICYSLLIAAPNLTHSAIQK